MPRAPRRTLSPIGALLALALCPAPARAAGRQEPATGELPVSLERIRAAVDKPEVQSLTVPAPPEPPVARFEITVEQRRYMLSFEEQLHKDLELTPLQRQSQEWASRCCGLDLSVLFNAIDRAWQQRKERKIRERIVRELDEVKAAAGRDDR